MFSRAESVFLIDFMLENSTYQFKEAPAQSLAPATLFHPCLKNVAKAATTGAVMSLAE